MVSMYPEFLESIGNLISQCHPKITAQSVTMNTDLKDDLGLDSTDISEILAAIETSYTIEFTPAEESKMKTAGDIVVCLSGQIYPGCLESVDIQRILPHGPGFTFVDRVISLNMNMDSPQIKGIYNVSASAWWAPEHFQGNPVMPGVLILEGLNQTAGILLYFLSERKKGLAVFTGFDKGLIRKSAVPGDRIEYFVRLSNDKRGIYTFHAEATVNNSRCLKTSVKLGKV